MITRWWSLLLRRLFHVLRKSLLTSSFPVQPGNPCITEKTWWITLLRQAFVSTLKLLKKLQEWQRVVVVSWLLLFSQQVFFTRIQKYNSEKKRRDQKNANMDLNSSKYMTLGWGWEKSQWSCGMGLSFSYSVLPSTPFPANKANTFHILIRKNIITQDSIIYDYMPVYFLQITTNMSVLLKILI